MTEAHISGDELLLDALYAAVINEADFTGTSAHGYVAAVRVVPHFDDNDVPIGFSHHLTVPPGTSQALRDRAARFAMEELRALYAVKVDWEALDWELVPDRIDNPGGIQMLGRLYPHEIAEAVSK